MSRLESVTVIFKESEELSPDEFHSRKKEVIESVEDTMEDMSYEDETFLIHKPEYMDDNITSEKKIIVEWPLQDNPYVNVRVEIEGSGFHPDNRDFEYPGVLYNSIVEVFPELEVKKE